ncbi:MAG: class I SAM-dependent methyltransferase [Proteobacteria bacterium]|nr:class I SAM-dependent methyltransferase [Pseudomonadota bacterium]
MSAKRKREKKQGKRKRKSGGKTLAQRADRHDLYEQSVQDVEFDVGMVRRTFKKYFGRRPTRVREDFCGTASFACAWAADHRENLAWGIDLDPDPLAYGRKHHLAALDETTRKRVTLIEGNVLEASHEPVDVTVAFNFSYFVFQDRDGLRAYFEKARSTLADEGLLMLDIYGGADAQRTMSETREHDGFDYVWDQHSFDPIHHHAINHIHFEFPDGSELRRAFSYDWRLWTLPELRELLAEAGFSASQVYWEGTEQKTGEGNGIYRKVSTAPDDPAWISYMVAIK